ncbi:MAG TPA: CotH kinase family protein, partial [Planctomycetota bacterium]|nr:CotH kinase family protein [Planctomycetota bacterium]
GLYEGDVLVNLSTPTPGAEIRYTTNGSVPNVFNSAVYTGTISVTHSTILRAIATSPGRAPSRLFTRSYLFIPSVTGQPTAPSGLPSTWGSHSTNGYAAPGVPNPFTAVANYGVNAGLVGASRLRESLLALPTVSLVTAPEDMFPEATGIYSNPAEEWTRPASFEFLTRDGSPSIQVDSGVQIHGGGSRLPWLTPKHSFRLQFQGRYGPDRLHYPLFGEGATDEFDSVVLRASFNDSWVANLGSSQFAIYAKDAYLRRLQRELGHPSARSRFAHLFVNGLYWGLYQPTERPDGRFQAKYLGGKARDYDVIKHRAPDIVQGDLAAWNTLYNLAGPSAQAYAAVQSYLNLDNFIDYMMLNFYFGTSDWLPNNWYAARKREPQAGYRFYVWDAELAFKNDDRTAINVPDSPGYIYDQLKGNPEFRLRFADRAYRACFTTGPLTPSRATAILLEELQEAAVGLVGESARWGDWQGTPVYTPESHFTNNMFGSALYLGTRRDIFIGHLRGAGLYPSIDPPVFNQHGGAISSGFQLAMTATSPGTILFTLDGSDPRLPGGAISSSAWTYSAPVAFPGFVSRVRARLKNGNEWSALVDATFSSESVLIGEFLARNTTGIMDNMGEREDWIEIHNPTTASVDLSGCFLTDNIQQPTKWAFPQGTTLSAGGRLIVWADDQVAQGPLHANFKLSASGEQVWLFLPDGITVLDGIIFGPQMDDISLGRLPDGEGAWVSLLDPTPGLPNETSSGIVRFGNINPALHSLRLGMLGTPAVGTSSYLVASTVLGGLPHHFVAGTHVVDLPVPGTVTRLLAGPFPLLYMTSTASTQGTALAPLVIPPIPSLVGMEAVFQVFVVAGPNILSSNGLKVRVGP